MPRRGTSKIDVVPKGESVLMRRGILVSGLAVVVIALAGCGSSKSSSSTSTSAAPASSTASTSTTTATTSTKAKANQALSRTYAVRLTGPAETPPGASSGSAKAVLTLSTKTNKVCWTFTSLSGFSNPTYAHIHI